MVVMKYPGCILSVVAGCTQVDKLEVPSYQSEFRWQDYSAEEYLGNWCEKREPISTHLMRER